MEKIDIEEQFTNYEIARIIGARALQLAMDAPVLIKITKEQMEEMKCDPLRIAEAELRSGVLPITVKRPMPKRREEKFAKVREVVEEKKKEDKAKVEEKGKKEDKIIEKKEETEEKEIKEDGEIMELAQPEDEVEVEETSEAEEA